MCVLITAAIFSFSINVLSKHILNESIGLGIWSGAKTVVPFASVLTTIWVQDYLYRYNLAGAEMTLISACIVSLFVGLVINVPVICLVNKRTQVIGLMCEALLPANHRQRAAHI
jgi:hypothetical protein